ncbi:MAG TPA: DUF4097 family beta strand repeat-containing protein [Ktedonobacteraceae bacterium]
MQNQEHMYEQEQPSRSENGINTDPREQERQVVGEYRSYGEGYGGPSRGDVWSEGEKLRVEPQSRDRRSVGWVLSMIVLICAVFIAGSIFGVILTWLSWAVLTILITVGIVAFILNWRVVTIPMPERRFQINEHARLVINNGLGKVAIRRGEPNAITVNATKRASGFGTNPEQMQIMYDQRGDTLGITTRVHWNIFQFGLRSIHFEITVPENCDVQLNNGSGRVYLQGASGDIRVRTGSGRIEASELEGQIALKTGSGGIVLNELQGQIDVRTGSGGLKLNNLQGQVDVVTGSGGIESYGLRGQIALKTGSGGISMQRSHFAGTSRVSTGSGGITFDGSLDPLSETLLKTGSGGIVLRLPDDSTFSLDAKTGSGGVVNSFGGREVGDGPRARLKLRSGSGGIRIARIGHY